MQSKLFISILLSASLISCLHKSDTESESGIEDRPDYLSDTQEMVREGKYKEALERYIWYHDHMLEQDSAIAGVRLSFALSYWKSLGNKYPPALDSLINKRDVKTNKIRTLGLSVDLFKDVQAINRTLKENQKTVELYEFISEKYPLLAKETCNTALNDLLHNKKYDLIQKNIGNIVEYYERTESKFRKSFKAVETEKGLKSYMEKSYVESTLSLIKYCLAVNDIKSAVEIQNKSLAFFYDKKIKNAIPD